MNKFELLAGSRPMGEIPLPYFNLSLYCKDEETADTGRGASMSAFSPRVMLLLICTIGATYACLLFAGRDHSFFNLALAILIVTPLIRILGGFESDGYLKVRHAVVMAGVAMFIISAGDFAELAPAVAVIAVCAGVWFLGAALVSAHAAETSYKYLFGLYTVSFVFGTVYILFKSLAPPFLVSAFASPFVDGLVVIREWVGVALITLTVANVLWEAAIRFAAKIRAIIPKHRGDGGSVTFPASPSPGAAIKVILDFLAGMVEFIFRVILAAGGALAEAILAYCKGLLLMKDAILLSVRSILAVVAMLGCIRLFRSLAPGSEQYIAGDAASPAYGRIELGRILYAALVPRIDIGWAYISNWFSIVALFGVTILVFGLVYVLCARATRQFARIVAFEMILTYFYQISVIWLVATAFAAGCAASLWPYACASARHGSLWLAFALAVLLGMIVWPFTRKRTAATSDASLLPEAPVEVGLTSGDAPAV